MLHSFFSGALSGGDVRFHFALTREEAESLQAKVAGEGRRVTECRASISGDPDVWLIQAFARRRAG